MEGGLAVDLLEIGAAQYAEVQESRAIALGTLAAPHPIRQTFSKLGQVVEIEETIGNQGSTVMGSKLARFRCQR